MFINEKILIRRMKQAYNKGSGVLMAREDGWYHLKAGYWYAKIAVGFLPRSILALMIEMSGVIPEEGEHWTSDKEKDQYELYLPALAIPRNRYPMYKRRLALLSPGGKPLRVLQLASNEIMTFDEELVAAADPACLDGANDEGTLEGPFYNEDGGCFWETKQAVWNITEERYPELDTIAEHLGKIPLEIDDI
jgi:hypothetical protein